MDSFRFWLSEQYKTILRQFSSYSSSNSCGTAMLCHSNAKGCGRLATSRACAAGQTGVGNVEKCVSRHTTSGCSDRRSQQLSVTGSKTFGLLILASFWTKVAMIRATLFHIYPIGNNHLAGGPLQWPPSNSPAPHMHVLASL
jgi:hypothetical protein